MPITVCVALLPRYVAKAWQFGFVPNDIDILRYIAKTDPHRDLARDAYLDGRGLKAMKREVPTDQDDALSRRTSRSSYASVPPRTSNIRHPNQGSSSADVRSASRTDMSTGIRSVHRGFDFATEEGGVAMRRMQSNISSRRNLGATHEEKTPEPRKKVFSLRKGLLKRKPPP